MLVPFFGGGEGKLGWFSNADHFVSNWMLPVGGFMIAVVAGWIMTRKTTHDEIMDGNQPRWFNYQVWRVFIRYVAPAAILAIIIAVITGEDFS